MQSMDPDNAAGPHGSCGKGGSHTLNHNSSHSSGSGGGTVAALRSASAHLDAARAATPPPSCSAQVRCL